MKQVKLFFKEEYRVIKFINPYKNANTFIIQINASDILIIDIGNYPIDELVDWINSNNKNILGVILTHEHADHCYGVDALKSKIDFTLFCSERCEVNMRNPKQNFSRYIEEIKTFGVLSKANIIKDGQVLNFDGFELTVMETPGHSPGGICLFAKEMVFAGDTILNNVKSPVSFPHSNKKEYEQTKNKIVKKLKRYDKIFPGHGEPFLVNEYFQSDSFLK